MSKDMNKLQEYVGSFFDELEVFEDIARGHNYKAFIREAILEFLTDETKQNAFAVYSAFFDGYRITLEGETNPFIDLLDVLLSYEENASTLIDKQRDHYIHSVNVFILGLCIYSKNKNYRNAFDKTNMDKNVYPFSYYTRHEEFFYRWGIASLFHDVGYPIEIINKQINQFLGFATKVDGNIKVTSHLEFENFEELNTIAEVIPKQEFIKSYYEKYESCIYVDLLKPVDLLAHKLHLSLGLEIMEIKSALDNFVNIMAKGGFVDHGYYSAIIVLKWYGFLIQVCHYKPEYFFYPFLDSASAILLHNYYRNVIMKPPFRKEALHPESHPVAWLLILCDELQEWNRQAYGSIDKKRTHAAEAFIEINDKRLDVCYISIKDNLPAEFPEKKKTMLNELLKLDVIFNESFSVNCRIADSIAMPSGHPDNKEGEEIIPRPLLDNLEKLAIEIHRLYNQKQLERHPGKSLEFPHFADLPGSMKYSNLRQAKSILHKLKMLNCEMKPVGSAGQMISVIPEEVIETLAIAEHEDWVQERKESGWIYGEKKDIAKKISPYIQPYEKLPEEIKKLDRDAIRNIPALLNTIGMAAFKKQ